MNIALIGNADNSHMFRWYKVLREMGHIVTVFSPVKPSRNHDYDNHLIVSSADRRVDILYYIRLARILKHYDVINLHMPLFKSILLFLLPKNSVAVNILGSEVIYFPRQYPLLYPFLTKVFERAKEIIAPNNFLCKEVRKFSNKRLNVKKIIYGIDTDNYKFHRKSKPDKLSLLLPKEFKYVYGTDILLKAFLKLQDKYPGIELTLTGKRDIPHYVNKLIEQSPNRDSIHTPGWVDNMDELLRESHITVLPSYSESFGVVALESILTGTPVIAHNTGGLTEILENSGGGMLYDKNEPNELFNAINNMIIDYNKWIENMEEASNFVRRNYSKEIQKKQMRKKWLKY